MYAAGTRVMNSALRRGNPSPSRAQIGCQQFELEFSSQITHALRRVFSPLISRRKFLWRKSTAVAEKPTNEGARIQPQSTWVRSSKLFSRNLSGICLSVGWTCTNSYLCRILCPRAFSSSGRDKTDGPIKVGSGVNKCAHFTSVIRETTDKYKPTPAIADAATHQRELLSS